VKSPWVLVGNDARNSPPEGTSFIPSQNRYTARPASEAFPSTSNISDQAIAKGLLARVLRNGSMAFDRVFETLGPPKIGEYGGLPMGSLWSECSVVFVLSPIDFKGPPLPTPLSLSFFPPWAFSF